MCTEMSITDVIQYRIWIYRSIITKEKSVLVKTQNTGVPGSAGSLLRSLSGVSPSVSLLWRCHSPALWMVAKRCGMQGANGYLFIF